MLDQLLSSRVLTISRSADFDQFRSIERLGDARSIPLSWRNFSAAFAAVTLKSCSIFLQRTFPRILQTRYVASGAIVAFAMDDAMSVIIDGVEVRQPSLRSSPLGDAGRVDLSQYLQLVRKLDEYLQDNTGTTLQSMEIAGQFGVSVRTLNNAVVAIRGLSLHRYTRLRRLWRVRQQLVQGAAAESLKAIALANGFWHMGEFRTLYRDLFGETPQQTLEVARGH